MQESNPYTSNTNKASGVNEYVDTDNRKVENRQDAPTAAAKM